MRIKLKVFGRTTPVVHHPAAVRVDGGRRYYFLGRGADCFLSCEDPGVQPRHCVIVVADNQAVIHAVDPAGLVLVNSIRVMDRRVLLPGDILQIGGVKFEVMMPADSALGAEPGAIAKPVVVKAGPPDESSGDAQISQWLDSVDAIERARLVANPELRRYQPETTAHPEDEALFTRGEDTRETSRDDSFEIKKADEKKSPGKLPAKPRPAPVRSDEAAASTLTRVYGNTIQNLVKKTRE